MKSGWESTQGQGYTGLKRGTAKMSAGGGHVSSRVELDWMAGGRR